MAIKKSIRSLYKIIGNTIGKQVWNRISVDEHISLDPTLRKELAYKCIDLITECRKLLQDNGRSPEKIIEFMNDASIAPEHRLKLISWVLEAYLLLNQSSTASADVTKTLESDKIFSKDLIENLLDMGISKSELEDVFTKDISASLVLTAHPTAGIQPDYMYHIANMISRVQEIAEVIRDGENNLVLEHKLKGIQEDLAASISHMVRVKPYNENKLKPSDESQNFLDAINQIYEIIPEKLIRLETEISNVLNKKFKFCPEFFKIHSWVARDIDGNPTVSAQEHFKALVQENLFFFQKYYLDLQRLWKTLSDDFSSDKDLPSKTLFIDEEFKNLYESILAKHPELGANKLAYRLVIEYHILSPLSRFISELEMLHSEIYGEDKYNFNFNFNKFSIDNILLKPLKAIMANKEGVNTKEIEKLIKKVEIFGRFGSKGHTRQGNEIINLLVKKLLNFENYGQIEEKTKFLINPDERLTDLPKNIKATVNELKDSSDKNEAKALQTLELLSLISAGGIKRQIISMNTCFEDMLNALLLITCFRGFNFDTILHPRSENLLDIVPLTEQIIDLRNSYQCTIEALLNPVWRRYLLKNAFKFIKMRGPSDSGKQNGFTASQWEMFRSKQLDAITVNIFNSFLMKHLYNDASELEKWQKLYNPELEDNYSLENKVVGLSLEQFITYFESEFDDEKNLWLETAKYYSYEFAQIKLISFDGWGEPVERGGGLEFKTTATCTQPLGSFAHYERTLQGGGAQQLVSVFRSHEIIQDFIAAVSEISARNTFLNNFKENKSLMILDPVFVKEITNMIQHIREKLRFEVLGLDLDKDDKCSSEKVLREYFNHVIKSPLIYLDLFNIASRPTSRSGTKIKEVLSKDGYNNDLNLFANKLPVEDILNTLADVRAIPYSAMFNLIGGNHVSFYGYQGLIENKNLVEILQYYYHYNQNSQEARLTQHIMDSLERGIFTADLDIYSSARAVIEGQISDTYKPEEDVLLQKLITANQATRNFIAHIKKYPVANPEKVKLTELLQNSPDERDLMLARRNDAAVPRLGIAYSMSQIIADSKERKVNPLDITTIQTKYLDLLRKAFAAGASTFGNGCID